MIVSSQAAAADGRRLCLEAVCVRRQSYGEWAPFDESLLLEDGSVNVRYLSTAIDYMWSQLLSLLIHGVSSNGPGRSQRGQISDF